MVVLQLALHLRLLVAPDADLPICLEVLHLGDFAGFASCFGRVFPSGSSSRGLAWHVQEDPADSLGFYRS